ncbi:hypothetical protein [Brevibacterium casei]|uniref:Uncharacterized protein n=1 Tax=Brevibacterium casei TaxID=33889 RepID=A0A7T2WPB1_9MICO|nr:hypothetical protein [Brevibacterium casei]QPS33988.1 hypothetical protein I6G59_01195 [Brevibacterium casei]
MPTMFAAYDYYGEAAPRFFPLADSSDDSATIATRAYDLGVRMKAGRMTRELVSMSDDTALIHFGTLVRFPDRYKCKTLAMYAVGASEYDKDGLVRIAEIATLDPGFMVGMWDHRQPIRRDSDGKLLPEQDHLHIALVTDLQAPARYAANAIDTEATA